MPQHNIWAALRSTLITGAHTTAIKAEALIHLQVLSPWSLQGSWVGGEDLSFNLPLLLPPILRGSLAPPGQHIFIFLLEHYLPLGSCLPPSFCGATQCDSLLLLTLDEGFIWVLSARIQLRLSSAKRSHLWSSITKDFKGSAGFRHSWIQS